MTFLFNYFFEPFVVYKPEHKMNFFWISIIHSCSPLVCLLLFGIKKIPVKTENWTVRKEILLILVFLLLVGVTQFLVRDIIYNNPYNWSWGYFFDEIRNTFLIGSLFSILLISLNYNRLNSKYNRSAQSIKISDKGLQATTDSIVSIETQVQTDAFKLNLDTLLFAKADGNYVEVYLNENVITKIVKRITLKELELQLMSYPHIFRTHRSYLVNLSHVQSVAGNAQGYKLRLNNYDKKIPVARNRIQEFDAAARSF